MKRPITRYSLVLSILLLTPITNHAKQPSKLRIFFNHLHFNCSMGYGQTSYQNYIINYGIFAKDGQHYLYPPTGTQTAYLVRWFDKPYIRQHIYESDKVLADLRQQTNGSTHTSFYGTGQTLPFTLSGHVDIKQKWRIEIGGKIYLQKITKLVPEAEYKHLGTYSDPAGIHYTTKLFVLFGHKLLENAAYSLLLNTQLSYDFLYGNLLKDDYAISSNLWSPATGIGITLEKHISEYLSLFGRIMYEKVVFNDKIEELDKNIIVFYSNSVVLQIGITFNWTEIPRCSVPGCKIEVKHKHVNTPYRGVALPTGESSLGYKLYKK